MSEFNLIDEPWISVVTDYKGTTKLVGLKEFFQNAETYIDFAGDMPTQDFAVMRFILAILHTVFSRYDADGKPYEMVDLNKKMQQVENVDEEDEEEYEDALMETWGSLWKTGKFPEIVIDYLESWHDRFYLFDDDYPFYQVTKETIKNVDVKFDDNTSDTSTVTPKLINRTISESNNKDSLFSPKSKENKNILTNAQITRWLITFQGISNASDKKSINKIKGKSIGWIYNLGGVFISSDNLFKTLILNLVLKHPEPQYNVIQKPCWEFNQVDAYNKYLSNRRIDNIAELYTNWSRLMFYFTYVGGKKKELYNVRIFRVVKTNSIDSINNFLEPMTIWETDEKNSVPKKHEINKATWRSFGLYINQKEKKDIRLPGILDNLELLKNIDKRNNIIQINSISAIYGNNASSRVLVNELYDNFKLELFVATDVLRDGWVGRINNVVDKTIDVVDNVFGSFVKHIMKIRKIKSSNFYYQYEENLYYALDKPFRDWLASIDYKDDKDEKTDAWYKELKKITINQAEEIAANSSPRDFEGIIENDSVRNIATAFNFFIDRIKEKL